MAAAALTGSSMEGIAGGENLLLTAADDKGITMSHSGLIRETPKKLQDSFKNVFSLGCDKSLFSLSTPPQKSSCHYCGLSASLRCSQCKQIYYCSADCQKEDWPAHSVVCEPIKQNVSNNNGGKLAAKTEKGIYFKTEEHIKKIMLSDLQAPGIKKAMEVQGTVTEFKSPSEFYIQMSSPEVSDQISKLSVKLQDCYAHTVTQEEYIAVKGEVCIARCSLDQTWNRALIKDVDILQKKAQVFYIDYGNEENIPLSWIKALHKDIELLFPPCKKDGMKASPAFLQLMGKHCSVTIVDILHEEMMLNFAVDIVVPNLEDCLRKVPVERRTDLTPGSNAKRADSPRVSKNCSKGSKGKIPADEEFRNYANSVTECVSVCIGAAFSGVVSHVQNPENFFCQHIHSARQLAELQASLNEHCDKFPSSPAFRPAVGDVCCAQFTEDDLWYRAAVLAYASEDTVFVVYIDYGNSEVLPLTRLRPVIPRLVDLPAQAIKCTLAGVKPPRGAWTSKAVSVMKQLVNNKVFAVKVVDKDSYSSVVELVDASVTPGISVSRCLVEKGCAAEESRMASPAARRSDVKQSDETSLGHWKPIELAIGETLSVCVTEVDSPDLFYVIPLQIKDKEKLRRQVIELEDYCKSCKNQPFTPKLGEACCARFSGDGCWYRAFVLKAAQSAVRVLYADYGNTETLPLSKVLPIPDSYLNLPFQTIMCSLADIEKAEWSPLLLDKLKEMILNKHIRITVKGINGNVHLVMVEKLSGSSCLNVADQLVMEGFVKLHTKELHTEHQAFAAQQEAPIGCIYIVCEQCLVGDPELPGGSTPLWCLHCGRGTGLGCGCRMAVITVRRLECDPPDISKEGEGIPLILEHCSKTLKKEPDQSTSHLCHGKNGLSSEIRTRGGMVLYTSLRTAYLLSFPDVRVPAGNGSVCACRGSMLGLEGEHVVRSWQRDEVLKDHQTQES
ncbi:LOW QUALITY PROTEIN: tudor domain-containing protein 1 [Aegotheles albertisi]